MSVKDYLVPKLAPKFLPPSHFNACLTGYLQSFRKDKHSTIYMNY